MSALIVTEKAGIFGRARLLLEIDPRKRSAYATLLPPSSIHFVGGAGRRFDVRRPAASGNREQSEDATLSFVFVAAPF